VPLLPIAAQRLQIDAILLQEVWHLPDGFLKLRQLNNPITKLRNAREGGGVVIITHKDAKTVHMKQYELDGLEAVWADVMCGSVRTIIGSVYIPPGDFKAMKLFDTVIGNIISSHGHVIVGLDANARSLLWDDKCIGISQYRASIKMGTSLENIIDKYNFDVLNDGSCTYHSGRYLSSPDVTISVGLVNINWSIIDDDLNSPHDAILIDVGTKSQYLRKEVIDWSKFDWKANQDVTGKALNELSDKWMSMNNTDVDVMAKELNITLQECVDQLAVKKVVTEHSKPWINKELANLLKHLRCTRRKCRLRRNRANVNEYVRVQKLVVGFMEKAEEEWWLSECEKLSEVSESQKWKLINKLTNQSSTAVQPILKVCNGTQEYLFTDNEICRELEDYHISKTQNIVNCDLNIEKEI